MAQSDERVPGLGGLIEPIELDNAILKGVQLPPAVKENPQQFYVQWYTTRDGRTFFEFYQYGAGGKGADGRPNPDPIYGGGPVEGNPNPAQVEKWEKEQKEAAKPAPTVNVNGVPSVVVGKDAQGRDIYAPVQTPTGPATATATTPRTPSQEAADAKATREEAERKRNRELPADQDPADETDEERRKRAQDRIAQQGRDEETARQRKRQEEADARAAAERMKPATTILAINGERYTQIVTPSATPGGEPKIEFRGPDGKAIPRLPAEITPGTVIKGGGPNGEDVQAVVGTDGRISFQPIPGAPTPGAGLKNIPPWQPDPTKPDLGISERATQLAPLIGKPADQGGISKEEYDEAIKRDHALAATTLTNLVNAHTTATAEVARERAEVGRRQTQASGDYTNDRDAALKIAMSAGEGGFGALLPYFAGGRRGAETLAGGTAEIPKVPPLPWLTNLMAQVQGGAPGASPQQPAPAGTSTFPWMTPGGPPSELGQPGDPPMTGGPVFRPPPPVTGSVAPPPVPPAPPVRDDWRMTPGGAPQAFTPMTQNYLHGVMPTPPAPFMPSGQMTAPLAGNLAAYDPRKAQHEQRLLGLGFSPEAVALAMSGEAL